MGVLTTMKPDEIVLNQDQFNTLKEIYDERLVDNMSTKDMSKWVDSLTFDDAMVEFKEYWDEYFTDTIDEVLEITPNV